MVNDSDDDSDDIDIDSRRNESDDDDDSDNNNHNCNDNGMRRNRSCGRTVRILAWVNSNQLFGGLILTPGVTGATFHTMIAILFVFEAAFTVLDINGIILQRNQQPLVPGDYFLFSTCKTSFFAHPLSLYV